jgi:hypothetical protein
MSTPGARRRAHRGAAVNIARGSSPTFAPCGSWCSAPPTSAAWSWRLCTRSTRSRWSTSTRDGSPRCRTASTSARSRATGRRRRPCARRAWRAWTSSSGAARTRRRTWWARCSSSGSRAPRRSFAPRAPPTSTPGANATSTWTSWSRRRSRPRTRSRRRSAFPPPAIPTSSPRAKCRSSSSTCPPTRRTGT